VPQLPKTFLFGSLVNLVRSLLIEEFLAALLADFSREPAQDFSVELELDRFPGDFSAAFFASCSFHFLWMKTVPGSWISAATRCTKQR